MGRPIVVLVRRVGRWRRWGSYSTVERAEAAWKKSIQGRGVTAWTWFGPAPEAAKMLADPNYMPPEECREATPTDPPGDAPKEEMP